MLDLGLHARDRFAELDARHRRRSRRARALALGRFPGAGADRGGLRHPLRHDLVALRQCAGRVLSTQHLLDVVRPKPGADFVVLHSYDGYTTNLTLEDFASEDALLAHSWEGKPPAAEHGGPVRLVAAEALFLEEREMAEAHRVRDAQQAGLLGSARLSRSRRSLAEQRYSDD